MQPASIQDFLTGFATSLALIIAIGAQNAFVLRQGILRQHVLPIVAFCALSDAALIALGVGGAGALIQSHPLLLAVARYGGAAFLLVYGLLAARRAWQGHAMHLQAQSSGSVRSALAMCFAFTFLNPHVYLDTVVLLGAIASQRGEEGRWVFGTGAMTASLIWFSALGFGARFLAPWFQRVIAWRILDSLIALVMLMLAVTLLLSS